MTDTSADLTPEPTVQDDAGAAGTQPDYKAKYEKAMQDANNWRSRFTGLQGKYQQEQEKWADDANKLHNIETQFSEVSGIREQLELTIQGLNEQLDSAQTESVVAKEELDRLHMVTVEFPELVPFLQDDLIPDGAGDELRTKLQAMSTRIASLQETTVAKHVEGASPSQKPASADTKNPTNLLNQAFEAMRDGNIAEYNKLYDEYLKNSTQGGQ